MNIKILQAENSIENVSNSVLSALYNAHTNGDISLEVDENNQKIGLIGSITASAGYAILVSTLNSAYPKFHVTVNSEYISFEDANVELVLLNIGLGDGVGITTQAASNATFTNNTFKNNTTITSFNEFPYFTKANTNPPTSLFEGCSNLEEIDLTSVTTTSQYEFRSSGIKTANLPSVTSLGIESFAYCSNLETVTDLGNVTSIPNYCFRNNQKLSSVVLPTTVTYLGIMAFSNYNSGFNSVLTTITGLNNVRTFSSLSLCEHKSLNLDASLISSATYVGAGAFSWVPMTGVLNLKNLVQIDGEYAFYNGKYNKIQCLGKISTIPGRTFMGNTATSDRNLLTEVYLPYECTSIGQSAFELRTNLTTIKLYTLSIDNWVEGETPAYGDTTRIASLGNNAFSGCSKLTSISLSSVTSIPNGCFAGCTMLNNIDLSNVITIGASAFTNCLSLTSVTLPSICTSISHEAFKGCSSLIGTLNLPNLTILLYSAFYNTGITKVKNLGSITELQSGIFYSCSNLTEVNIPTTVTILNDNVFTSCPNLRKITGFDNIISVSKNNYQIYNTTITNPVGFKNFTQFPNISGLLKSSIFFVSGQEGDMNIYSLFYPKLLSTAQCSETWYGSPKNSFFLSRSVGSKRLITGLLYFKDITSFGTGTFFAVNITNLVINNATPPTLDNSDTTYNTESWWASWGEYIFGNGDPKCTIGTLWVPDSAVATYQADPLYSMLTIKGINTKTNGVDYDLPRYANFAAWEAAEEAAVAQGGHAPQGLIEAWM